MLLGFEPASVFCDIFTFIKEIIQRIKHKTFKGWNNNSYTPRNSDEIFELKSSYEYLFYFLTWYFKPQRIVPKYS